MFNVFERILLKFSAHPKRGPVRFTVEYKYVDVDKYNIEKLKRNFISGRADCKRCVIIIFKFIFSPALDPALTQKILKVITCEKQIIEHEKKHLENTKCPWEFAFGYYEVALLSALNEVSAYTAQLLSGNPPVSRQNMLNMLDRGIWEYNLRRKDYLHMHMNFVARQCDVDSKNPDFKKNLLKDVNCKRVHYSHKFYKIADYYLTFGDYRLLDFGYIPTPLKREFVKLKQVYEDATREQLREFLR